MSAVTEQDVVKLRAELRASTGLVAERLKRLIADLRHPIGVYLDQVTGEEQEKASDWCEKFALAYEQLVEAAEGAPTGVLHQPDLKGRQLDAMNARADANLLKKKNPPAGRQTQVTGAIGSLQNQRRSLSDSGPSFLGLIAT